MILRFHPSGSSTTGNRGSARSSRVGSLAALAIALVLGLAAEGRAQDNLGIAVVMGKNHAYTLEAPEGWVLDIAGARSSNLGAAFRPEEASWGASPVVMYVNSVLKQGDTVSARSVLEADAARAGMRLPKTIVEEAEPISTIQGVDAMVRHFVRSDSSLFEAVAYIDAPTVVALVVLSARSAEEFDACQKTFARLVDSYEWITSDPASIVPQSSR